MPTARIPMTDAWTRMLRTLPQRISMPSSKLIKKNGLVSVPMMMITRRAIGRP